MKKNVNLYNANIVGGLVGLLFTANLSLANDSIGYLPEDWMVSPEQELEQLKLPANEILRRGEERLGRLDRAIESIVSTNESLIDELEVRQNRKWRLSSIKTEFAVEPSGMLGFLAFKGESAVELIWKRKFPPKTTGESIAAGEKSGIAHEEIDSAIGTIDGDLEEEMESGDIPISAAMSEEELKREIAPLVAATVASGRVKNEKRLQQTLLGKAKEFQKMISGIENRPRRSSWWFYQFQLEVNVSAMGDISSLVSPVTSGGSFITEVEAGIAAQFKFVWKKIERKGATVGGEVRSRRLSDTKFGRFVNDLALDLESYGDANFQETGYDLNYIKVGIGIGAEGEIYVADASAEIIGSVFFKRDPKSIALAAAEKSMKEINPAEEEDYLYLRDDASKSNLELATRLGVERVLLESNKRSGAAVGESSLFKISRKSFQRGLKRTTKMAKFFLKAANRTPQRKWELDVIELEFELILSGSLGFATLRQPSVFELYFVKENR